MILERCTICGDRARSRDIFCRPCIERQEPSWEKRVERRRAILEGLPIPPLTNPASPRDRGKEPASMAGRAGRTQRSNDTA